MRLKQGRMDDSTVFSDNPVEMADRWAGLGARRLHIVDLDGAVHGNPRNAGLIHEIVERHPDLPVQIGGGIRDEETVEGYLDAGVRFVIIGTRAVNEPHFISLLSIEYPGHVIVGLDARDGKLAVEGWSKLSRHDPIDLAQHFETDGVHSIIYTDISRDGMMSGVNIEATRKLAESVRIPIIASGGVTNLEDLGKVKELETSGVEGVITGRAIYEGSLDFTEGQALLDQ